MSTIYQLTCSDCHRVSQPFDLDDESCPYCGGDVYSEPYIAPAPINEAEWDARLEAARVSAVYVLTDEQHDKATAAIERAVEQIRQRYAEPNPYREELIFSVANFRVKQAC